MQMSMPLNGCVVHHPFKGISVSHFKQVNSINTALAFGAICCEFESIQHQVKLSFKLGLFEISRNSLLGVTQKLMRNSWAYPVVMVQYGLNKVHILLSLQQSLIDCFLWHGLPGHSGQRTKSALTPLSNCKVKCTVNLKSPAVVFVFFFFLYRDEKKKKKKNLL